MNNNLESRVKAYFAYQGMRPKILSIKDQGNGDLVVEIKKGKTSRFLAMSIGMLTARGL